MRACSRFEPYAGGGFHLAGLGRFDNYPPHVVAAGWADHMLGQSGAALRAIRKLLRLFGVVRPPFASARIGRTSFRNGHGNCSLGSQSVGQLRHESRTEPEGVGFFGKRVILKVSDGTVKAIGALAFTDLLHV